MFRITAAVALAMASLTAPAAAGQWFWFDSATGACEESPFSPQPFYDFEAHHNPRNVTTDRDGAVHLHVTAAEAGRAGGLDFFTSMAACERDS